VESLKLLDMAHVAYRRQGKAIIDDLSWVIESGEHWALLGANGSGKTTLLKLLTAYEWASSGSIDVLGKRYGECHVGNHRKHMGWVSASLQRQIPGKDTAIQVVASGLEASFGWYGEWSDEIETQAREALERVGVGSLHDRTYATLSQGEQKRVQIARAVIHKPQLLILDEPCEGLDPVSRHSFLEDLASYVKESHAPSVVYVTHHIEEIGAWISHGLILKDGRSLASGLIGDVLKSEVLSDAFGKPCIVNQTAGEYRIDLKQ
jgi:iron complex transport system ATP-binding protein